MAWRGLYWFETEIHPHITALKANPAKSGYSRWERFMLIKTAVLRLTLR